MAIKVEKIEWGFYRVKGERGSVDLSFRYNSKRHRYIVNFDWSNEEKEFTEKEGETIMEFLDWLSTLTLQRSRSVEESFETQGA